ncbi:MAG: crossover junction endodeoxyribonuclease RuvC [Chloroflexi bacterium]|nr:MAG: crossover junction endodeoxyribonuclease RuvC [Chloroflexota bacterium]
MRVLGVDPGLGRTGVAVVEGAPGALRLVHAARIDTVPQTSEPARLANLYDLVADVLESYTPDVAAVEQLFFSTNRRTAMRVGEARGVILCAIGRAGVHVAEYTPTQVKEAVCGYGAAHKKQVMRMTSRLLALDSDADDVADACAVAVCHHHRARLSALTGTRRRQAGSSPLERAVARARARFEAARR